jgi:NhaP-type Na+/H+ and K+/H+ antiporter
MSVGATLSATDPVTILAIFDTYKVEPKLYTIIFGESILNDAVAIVLFETAQKYKDGAESLGIVSLFEAFGIFFGVFFGSLFIGVMVGIGASLMLKFTYVRRFPKTESCLIILIAYLTYFFSNAIHMSGEYLRFLIETISSHDDRNRVSIILRHMPQTLCLPQHVSSHAIVDKICLPSHCTVGRELYLHLSGFVPVH